MEFKTASFVYVLLLLVHSNLNSANQNPACPSCDQLDIEVEISGDELEITWTFNGTNVHGFNGFKTVIYQDDNTVLYQSPIIQKSQKEMSVHQELHGKNSVCVQALINSSYVLTQECEHVEKKDLKMVVGILAGTIFLIPCIIGLVYIIYKDRQIRNSQEYEKLGQGSLSERTTIVVEIQDEKPKPKANMQIVEQVVEVKALPEKGVDNIGFVSGTAVKDHNYGARKTDNHELNRIVPKDQDKSVIGDNAKYGKASDEKDTENMQETTQKRNKETHDEPDKTDQVESGVRPCVQTASDNIPLTSDKLKAEHKQPEVFVISVKL